MRKMFDWLSSAWEKTKQFFNRSWSIFLARLESITGLVLAGIAGIAAMDVTPFLTSTEVNPKTFAIMGGLLFTKGVLSEIGRRQNTVTLDDGQLMPRAVTDKKEAVKALRVRK